MTGKMKDDLFTWPEVFEDRNVHGPLSFAIPSSVAGYAELHARHGRLPLTVVMAPAVALARRGLAQDWFTTLKVANSASVLRLYAESARIYLPGGLPPVAPYQGSPGFFRQGNLAETLERLARDGLRDFYEGGIARRPAGRFPRHGIADLRRRPAGCKALVRPALEAAWRGKRLFLANGLTAAPTLLRVLEGMRGADFSGAAPSRRLVRAACARDARGLCRTARGPRRCGTEGGRILHHPPDRLRQGRDDGGDDAPRCCRRWDRAWCCRARAC